MNRRCVLQMLLGSTLAGNASAQKILTVAYLGSAGLEKEYVTAFRRGLADQGYVIGQNIEVLFRAAEGDFSRLPAIFAQATTRELDALLVVGNQAALFAKAANLSVPIVFVIGADPVDLGLAANYSKPTGNMTGVTFYTGALAEKRLEFLNELMPPNIPAAVLFNPETPQLAAQKSIFESAARALGRPVVFVPVASGEQFDNLDHKRGRLMRGDLFIAQTLSSIFTVPSSSLLPNDSVSPRCTRGANTSSLVD